MSRAQLSSDGRLVKDAWKIATRSKSTIRRGSQGAIEIRGGTRMQWRCLRDVYPGLLFKIASSRCAVLACTRALPGQQSVFATIIYLHGCLIKGHSARAEDPSPRSAVCNAPELPIASLCINSSAHFSLRGSDMLAPQPQGTDGSIGNHEFHRRRRRTNRGCCRG